MKIQKALLCLAVFVVIILSCSKNGEERVVFDATNPHPNAYSSLIGFWALETDESETLTFKWDGTVVYSNGSTNTTDNYKVKYRDGYSEQYDCDLFVMEFSSLEGSGKLTTRICKSNDFILYWSSKKKYIKKE